MSEPFINRELSWIEFNQRVLNEALREDLPLLDRVKFLAITDSNLDEFIQVRVGGLELMKQSSPRSTDIAGLTPNQQLNAIHKRISQFVADQYSLLNETLLPKLDEEGVTLLKVSNLSSHQSGNLRNYFEQSVLPLVSPFLLGDEGQPQVTIPHLEVCVACQVKDPESGETRCVFIPVPQSIPRRLAVEGTDNYSFVLSEDVVANFAPLVFPYEEILCTTPFRLTRNGDIVVRQEETNDFADEMEEVLVEREFSGPVRLQLPIDAPDVLVKALKSVTGLSSREIVSVPGPIALSDFMSLAFIEGFDHLRSESWKPQPSPDFDPATPIFDDVSEKDCLLIHPFQSFEPVVRMLEEAADDPNTIAIKQVLYRTAKNSRIIDALIRAAEKGKQVTVLVELKARFDEARNLGRADELQRAGVQVVYGVKGLKTHAKITLVVRNEDGHLRRYAHLGTGNYNESTAGLYTDVSYLTCRPEYTSDASLFFNAVTGRSKLVAFQKLVAAPTHMRPRLMDLIEGEIARAKEGADAFIMAKVNSLQDEGIIRTLYKASEAGVKIKLNVRGICCLKTGDHPGAKNIEVVSIIDTYLEHPRIFYFHQDGDPAVFISSADWMTRNLDKRVELMTPIEDKDCRRQLIDYLESCFKDNTQSSKLLADGTSQRLKPKKGQESFRLQKHCQNRAEELARISAEQKAASFEPHLPPEEE